MAPASRTPEGLPHRCPVCGKTASLEPCYPGGDSVCPNCGQLLWLFRERIGTELGVSFDSIKFESLLREKAAGDSLDLAELLMELEEGTGIPIPEEIAGSFRTVQDVIQYLRRRQGEADGG